MRSNKLLLAVGITLALTATACTSDDGTTDTTAANSTITQAPDTTVADTTPETDPTATDPSDTTIPLTTDPVIDTVPVVEVAGSVLDTIANTPELSEFYTIINDPAYVSVFTQDRGIAVFAVNNDGLSDEEVALITADPNARALYIGRHLIVAAPETLELLSPEATTSTGDKYAIDIAAGTIGAITVTTANIAASNGVVHIIASSLLPSEG